MDNLSREQRSACMARIKCRDTEPEMLVRRLLFQLGYRFRVSVGSVPGRPDVVFSKRRQAIFVQGCFWHQHTGCTRASRPRSNRGYWESKLVRNIERDARVRRALEADGWDVIVIWECEVNDPRLGEKLRDRLGPLRWIDGVLGPNPSPLS